MLPAAINLGPWALTEALLYLVAFIVFGKVTVVLLGVLQDVGNALYEAVTGPIRVYREYEEHGFRPDEQERGENNPNREPQVADGGAHEPPPNVLWPPDDAFEEDNRRENR